MTDGDNDDKKEDRVKPTGEFILESPGTVNVKHEDLPAKPAGDKKIHPRRPLPLVPEKPNQPAENQDDSDQTSPRK